MEAFERWLRGESLVDIVCNLKIQAKRLNKLAVKVCNDYKRYHRLTLEAQLRNDPHLQQFAVHAVQAKNKATQLRLMAVAIEEAVRDAEKAQTIAEINTERTKLVQALKKYAGPLQTLRSVRTDAMFERQMENIQIQMNGMSDASANNNAAMVSEADLNGYLMRIQENVAADMGASMHRPPANTVVAAPPSQREDDIDAVLERRLAELRK